MKTIIILLGLKILSISQNNLCRKLLLLIIQKPHSHNAGQQAAALQQRNAAAYYFTYYLKCLNNSNILTTLLFLFKIVYNVNTFSTRTGGITLKFEWDEDKTN